MSERPENPNATWLKSIAKGGHSGLMPKFSAKCALAYIAQLEAELAEAKLDSERLDKLRAWLWEESKRIVFDSLYFKGWKDACAVAIDKLEELEGPHE